MAVVATSLWSYPVGRPVRVSFNTHETADVSVSPHGGVEVVVRGPRGTRYLTLMLSPIESKRLGKLLWNAGEAAQSKREKP